MIGTKGTKTGTLVILVVVCAAVSVAVPDAAPGREPLDISRLLVARYPEKPSMNYISALLWSGKVRLSRLTNEPKWKEKAEQQMRSVDGDDPSSKPVESLTSVAGYFAFADLGEVEVTRKAADLVMPQHGDDVVRSGRWWTDDMFMATSLLARASRRGLDDPYARLTSRLLLRYAARLQRPDGLFVHALEAPFAWGRGNGFAALALADALTYVPESWPDRTRVLDIYRRHMQAMLRHQSGEGSWRQVVDDYSSYRELTVTAMTVAAMARGVRLGWLGKQLVPRIERGWQAVVSRVGDDGVFKDVCPSTGAGRTKDYYLTRPVINGPDDRGAAMTLLAALEVEELRTVIRRSHLNQ